MLSPLTSEIHDLPCIAYDLEWYPQTFEVRLVGVWDAGRYRSYTTVADFLDGELTHQNRGKYFFAHAGGSYDLQHLLEALAKNPDFEVSGAFSGAACVLCTVRKGKDKWTFGDSYYLLRDSLKRVGKTIGLEKGECAFDAPLPQLRTYNARDCEIVYEGLMMLQRELRELGGQMRPTLASSAMNLFRRAYLKRAISTSKSINDSLRPSYCASRVEVHGKYAPEAEYYDINSSFPYSMTSPQPGELVHIRMNLPRENTPNIWFVDAQVSVYEADLPPLPYKRCGRIFFPVGAWRGIFSKADIELLEESGGRLLKVYRAWEFEPFDDLGAYVHDLFARKLSAEKAGDMFKRYTYKLLLNALYGKFGERTTKDKILIHPEKTTCPHDPPHEDDACIEIVSPGIYRMQEERKVEHAHVPIASYVTSLSRALLWRYMSRAQTRYYCDTDSVVCGKGEALPTSDKLGDLKHEGTIRNAKFLCPKVYAFTADCEGCAGKGCANCHKSGEVRVVKAKGFSRLDSPGIDSLARGESVQVDRTRGIREGLRDTGAFGMARSKVREKRLQPGTIPKRRIVGNSTVPWTVEELAERGVA